MGSQKRGHGLGTAAPISSLRVLLSYAGGRMGGHMDTGIFFPHCSKSRGRWSLPGILVPQSRLPVHMSSGQLKML